MAQGASPNQPERSLLPPESQAPLRGTPSSDPFLGPLPRCLRAGFVPSALLGAQPQGRSPAPAQPGSGQGAGTELGPEPLGEQAGDQAAAGRLGAGAPRAGAGPGTCAEGSRRAAGGLSRDLEQPGWGRREGLGLAALLGCVPGWGAVPQLRGARAGSQSPGLGLRLVRGYVLVRARPVLRTEGARGAWTGRGLAQRAEDRVCPVCSCPAPTQGGCDADRLHWGFKGK